MSDFEPAADAVGRAVSRLIHKHEPQEIVAALAFNALALHLAVCRRKAEADAIIARICDPHGN